MDNFNIVVVRRPSRRGPGRRRLDRHHPQRSRGRATATARAARRPRTIEAAASSWPTSGRWSRSARGSTTIVKDPATADGAEALVPPVLQAAVLPRRIPADLQPAERHAGRHARARASSGSPRRGVVVDGVEYEVDCIDLRDRLRGRHRLHAPRRASSLSAAAAGRLSEQWARRHADLHGFYQPRLSRTASSSAVSQNGASPSNFTAMLDEQAQPHRLHHPAGAGGREPPSSPAPTAEAEWVDAPGVEPVAAASFLVDCTPGYYNNEGRPGEGPGWFGGNYGGGRAGVLLHPPRLACRGLARRSRAHLTAPGASTCEIRQMLRC